jgi:hypothetical protein
MGQNAVRLLRNVLAVATILLLVSTTANATMSTTALPTKETLIKEVSTTIQEREMRSECTGGWYTNNATNRTTCLGWTNTTYAGRSAYIFDTADEVIESHKSSPFDIATEVTVKARFVPTDLTPLVLSHLSPSDKTGEFNSKYYYTGRNITSNELTALKNELLDVPVSVVKGTIVNINRSKIDLSGAPSLSFSIDLTLEKISDARANGKVKFGAHSKYWNVTSKADFDAGVKTDADTLTINGSVIIEKNDSMANWTTGFEETGTPSGWSTYSGLPDYDSTTNVLEGNEALVATSTAFVYHPSYTASGVVVLEMWFYMTPSTYINGLFYESDYPTVERVIIDEAPYTDKINLIASNGQNHGSVALSTDTWYRIKYIRDFTNSKAYLYVYNTSGGLADSLDNGGSGYTMSSGTQYMISAIKTTVWYDRFKIYDNTYQSSGSIASWVNDSKEYGTRWIWLNWTGPKPSGTDISFKVRASDNYFDKNDANITWTDIGNGDSIPISNIIGRYFQWNATLTTNDNTATSQLDEVVVRYEPPRPQNITVKLSGEFDYKENESFVNLTAFVRHTNGSLISNAKANLTVLYPNQTVWKQDEPMSETSLTGVYTWGNNTSTGIPVGIYTAFVKAYYGGDVGYDMIAFHKDPDTARLPVISVADSNFLMTLSLLMNFTLSLALIFVLWRRK